jgi:hypothetical protein
MRDCLCTFAVLNNHCNAACTILIARSLSFHFFLQLTSTQKPSAFKQLIWSWWRGIDFLFPALVPSFPASDTSYHLRTLQCPCLLWSAIWGLRTSHPSFLLSMCCTTGAFIYVLPPGHNLRCYVLSSNSRYYVTMVQGSLLWKILCSYLDPEDSARFIVSII